VLDSVSSPITRRVYNLGLDEFFEWYGREPRPGFTKATVSACFGQPTRPCFQKLKGEIMAETMTIQPMSSESLAEIVCMCQKPIHRLIK
jgi:hypothetical protein